MAIRKKLQPITKAKKQLVLPQGNSYEAIKSRMAHYLSKGLNLKEAATLANCSYFILGKLRSDPDFEDFLTRCQAEMELEHIENLRTAAKDPKYWSASAFILERSFPDKYGKKDTVKQEVTVKVQTFQTIVLDVLNKIDPALKQQVILALKDYDTKLALPAPNEAMDCDLLDI